MQMLDTSFENIPGNIEHCYLIMWIQPTLHIRLSLILGIGFSHLGVAFSNEFCNFLVETETERVARFVFADASHPDRLVSLAQSERKIDIPRL